MKTNRNPSLIFKSILIHTQEPSINLLYINIINTFLIMQAETPQLKFKDVYTLQMRCKMVANLHKKSSDCYLVIIEKDDRCVKYPNLTTNMFLVSQEKTRMFILSEVKKRLSELMNRSLEKESLFMYTSKTILNSEDKMEIIYKKYKDVQDGILYLKYSSIEPF